MTAITAKPRQTPAFLLDLDGFCACLTGAHSTHGRHSPNHRTTCLILGSLCGATFDAYSVRGRTKDSHAGVDTHTDGIIVSNHGMCSEPRDLGEKVRGCSPIHIGNCGRYHPFFILSVGGQQVDGSSGAQARSAPLRRSPHYYHPPIFGNYS